MLTTVDSDYSIGTKDLFIDMYTFADADLGR
jgi:hypothetical protein